jgi:hypothetical protein
VSVHSLVQPPEGGRIKLKCAFLRRQRQIGATRVFVIIGSNPASSVPTLRRRAMKHAVISLLLLAGCTALSTIEASAYVRAVGVHRAVVVRPGGAAVVRRPVVVAPRRVVVVR